MIAAAKPTKVLTSSRKRTLDYTRRHVVVALLAVGRSRAQAAKYVRISPELLQRVADHNSRFRYDMRKAEVDYQTRKARRRLKRSLVDHASPDLAAQAKAEAQAAAQAEAAAQAAAEAKSTATADRIKGSLQNDGGEWLLENPEGRSIFYNRELPDLAELQTLAKSLLPLPPLPEFQPPPVPEFQVPESGLPESGLPTFSFDPQPNSEEEVSSTQNAVGSQEERDSSANPQSEISNPQSVLLESAYCPLPTDNSPSYKLALENKALARVRAQKTWRQFESRRKYRRVRIVATPKQRPIANRLRNSPNPKRPEIKCVVVCAPASAINAAPSPLPRRTGRGRSSACGQQLAETGLCAAHQQRQLHAPKSELGTAKAACPRHSSPGTLRSSLAACTGHGRRGSLFRCGRKPVTGTFMEPLEGMNRDAVWLARAAFPLGTEATGMAHADSLQLNDTAPLSSASIDVRTCGPVVASPVKRAANERPASTKIAAAESKSPTVQPPHTAAVSAARELPAVAGQTVAVPADSGAGEVILSTARQVVDRKSTADVAPHPRFKKLAARDEVVGTPTRRGWPADARAQPDWRAKSPYHDMVRATPAWLVSMMLHLVLLIVLGLWIVSVPYGKPAILTLTATVGAPDGEVVDLQDIEQALPEFDAAEVAHSSDAADLLSEPVQPQQLLDFAVSDATANALAIPAGDAGPIGAALSGRSGRTKQELLERYGGTAATELAVRLGLEWLKRNQLYDGRWSLRGPFDADGSGQGSSRGDDHVAATAMALLAFQGAGHTHLAGEYREQVAKGSQALLAMQEKDGMWESGRGYSHALASIAICELYAMSQDSRLREPAQRAVDACVAWQSILGGWRYLPKRDADLSVSGWFIMALQSARMAGLQVPEATMKKAEKYLDRVQSGKGSRYGYQSKRGATLAMTAEGLLCRQYFGWPREKAEMQSGIKFLLNGHPKWERRDVYFWYYATQVLHHAGGEPWERWNYIMREMLPAHQVTDGPESGSWTSDGHPHGDEGGRLYVTCMSLYILEVYYRHMPLYDLDQVEAVAGGELLIDDTVLFGERN